MKTLVLLLACLAAANAYGYVRPHCGYTYYNLRSCFVSVPSSCYHYSVYYCRQWYSAKYYSSVMKIYPGEKCAEDGFQEMSLAQFTTECKSKLKTKSDEILKEMNTKYDEWEKEVRESITKFKTEYKTRVDTYTDKVLENIEDEAEKTRIDAERIDAIALFNETVDDDFEEAKKAYKKAITTKHNSVLEYHQKIVDSSVKCYNDRQTKISEFTTKIGERVTDLLAQYVKCLNDVISKKTTRYHELLKKVHCDEDWESDLVTTVVGAYKTALETERDTKYGEYEGKLNEAKSKLIKTYTCAYQCYTYSGCLSFSRKSYMCACRSLGKWWSYSFTRKVSYFRYVKCTFTWTPRKYKCLRTCDLDTLNVSVEDFNKQIQDKADVVTEAADNDFTEWKEKWNGAEGYHAKYLAKYMEIVDERHEYLKKYLKSQLTADGEESTEDTAALKELEDELVLKRTEAETAYKKILDDRYKCAETVYSKRVENYKTSIGEIVTKITGNYKSCMETRTEKIGDYETKMMKVRDDLRKCLEERLNKIIASKSEQYYKLLEFYHGEVTGEVLTLYDNYVTKITAELNANYKTFDDHWKTLLADLVQHYSCGYKCSANIKFSMPSFNYCVGWRVCFPTSASYCYKYNFFVSHRYVC